MELLAVYCGNTRQRLDCDTKGYPGGAEEGSRAFILPNNVMITKLSPYRSQLQAKLLKFPDNLPIISLKWSFQHHSSQTQVLKGVASARKAMAAASAAVEGAKSKQGVIVGTLGEVLSLLKQLLGVA